MRYGKLLWWWQFSPRRPCWGLANGRRAGSGTRLRSVDFRSPVPANSAALYNGMSGAGGVAGLATPTSAGSVYRPPPPDDNELPLVEVVDTVLVARKSK
jgi:hypothetical protein